MTLTTLPAVLEPMVEKAAQAIYEADFEDDIPWWGDMFDEVREPFRHRARMAILAFLNAALASGVAREEVNRPSQFYDEKHEIRISLIRTGDT